MSAAELLQQAVQRARARCADSTIRASAQNGSVQVARREFEAAFQTIAEAIEALDDMEAFS